MTRVEEGATAGLGPPSAPDVLERALEMQRVLDLLDPAHLGEDHLEAQRQLAVLETRTMEAIRATGVNPNLLLDEAAWPAVPAWMGMRKQAIALHPIYRPQGLGVLGGTLHPEHLRRPLAGSLDAFTILEQQSGAAVARRIRERYDTFLTTEVTPQARWLLVAHVDARAIRWRAAASARLALEAARGWTGPVNLVSLACGAAGPVALLVDQLHAQGIDVASLTLVDKDPVALAAGRAVASQHLDPQVLRVELFDLIDTSTGAAYPLGALVPAGGAHMVEILGLFEYLPDFVAVNLLREVKAQLHPTGMVLLGNMLDVRPGQDSFTHVIQWPRLVQRSVTQVLELAFQAGYDLSRSTVAVPPAHDAVYSVLVLRQ